MALVCAYNRNFSMLMCTLAPTTCWQHESLTPALVTRAAAERLLAPGARITLQASTQQRPLHMLTADCLVQGPEPVVQLHAGGLPALRVWGPGGRGSQGAEEAGCSAQGRPAAQDARVPGELGPAMVQGRRWPSASMALQPALGSADSPEACSLRHGDAEAWRRCCLASGVGASRKGSQVVTSSPVITESS